MNKSLCWPLIATAIDSSNAQILIEWSNNKLMDPSSINEKQRKTLEKRDLNINFHGSVK